MILNSLKWYQTPGKDRTFRIRQKSVVPEGISFAKICIRKKDQQALPAGLFRVWLLYRNFTMGKEEVVAQQTYFGRSQRSQVCNPQVRLSQRGD